LLVKIILQERDKRMYLMSLTLKTVS